MEDKLKYIQPKFSINFFSKEDVIRASTPSPCEFVTCKSGDRASTPDSDPYTGCEIVTSTKQLDDIKFTIKLAGVNIKVHASFLSSKEFCKDYLTSEAADIEVAVTPDDIAFEAAASEIECSDKYYETLAIYRKIAEALIPREILLVHGSTLKVGGNGYMFTAASGVGKSTHAALWKKLLGEKATIINDDKPLLKITNGTVEVFGTPWSGEQNINTNTSAPLKAICFIEKSETNEIRQIEKSSAIDKLVPQIYKSENANNVIKTLELANLLMKNINFYQLKCNMNISAAELSYKALTV